MLKGLISSGTHIDCRYGVLNGTSCLSTSKGYKSSQNARNAEYWINKQVLALWSYALVDVYRPNHSPHAELRKARKRNDAPEISDEVVRWYTRP